MKNKIKKKVIVTAITGLFLVIAGICYSCAYSGENPSLTIASVDDKQVMTDQNNVVDQDGAQENQSEDVQSEEDIQSEIETKQSDKGDQKEDWIYAHICGAVVNPGVYKAEQGARIVDFITLSGGLIPEADGDYINQAETVSDGQRIYIPTKEEANDLDLKEYIKGYSSLGDTVEANVSTEKEKLVNLNEASANELMELPGIGQAKANSIIEYRKQHGPFKSTEELMNIPGIKEGLFNQISSKVTVD